MLCCQLAVNLLITSRCCTYMLCLLPSKQGHSSAAQQHSYRLHNCAVLLSGPQASHLMWFAVSLCLLPETGAIVVQEREEGLQGVFKRLRRNGHQLEK
jgi:hypothetical protein